MTKSNCHAIPPLRFPLRALLAVLMVAQAAFAQDLEDEPDYTEPRTGEYRVTLFPFHKLTDSLTGFGYLGYVTNPEEDYETGYLGYGMSYNSTKYVQWWGGLIGTYTDNDFASDRLELRPFLGLKLFLPNDKKWNIYNYARWEYRNIQDQDTNDWSRYSRFRNRVGIEIPFASIDQAWQPKTWYGLADAEVMYRTDRDTIDPARLRAGFAYIFNDRVRAEFIYHIQWTRPYTGSDLEFTENIFRLNIKVALNRGILRHVFDGGDPVD